MPLVLELRLMEPAMTRVQRAIGSRATFEWGPFRVGLESHIRVARVGYVRVAYVYHIAVVVAALYVVRCGATFVWSS